MTKLLSLALVLLAVTALAFSGCTTESANPTSSRQPSSSTEQASQNEDGHANGDHAAHMEMNAGSSDMDKMKSELAKLSPEDRAAAEKQHLCPVSGKMLGTMGAPYKVDINGQQVWLCCPGCEGQLRENPDEFLAKSQK